MPAFGKAAKTSRTAVIDQRRILVARLLLRGLTQREIELALAKRILNPDTNKPWSIATVNRDIKEIRAEWHAQYAKSYDSHVSGMLAEIKEVRREAWSREDFDLVLKCCDRECKLLGLDQPDKLAIVDWRREAQEAGIDAGDIFEKLVQEFAVKQTSD